MFRSVSARLAGAFAATPFALNKTTGRVVSFNSQKGFGFVEEGEGDNKKSHFVHFSALQVEGGFKAVNVGTDVEFEVAPDERDPSRSRAVNVTAPGGAPLPAPERNFNQGGDRGRGGGGGYRGRGGRGGRGGGGGYRGRGGNNYNQSTDDF